MKKRLFIILFFISITLNLNINAETKDYPDFITFMNMYNQTMISSHNKLILMNKPKKIQKLGKESQYGNISGTVNYKTKIKGFLGIVIIDYDNYSDEKDWIINGQTNVKANLFATGKMYGTINISGKYNAKIIYDNLIIKKGNAGGGYYIIQYENGNSGKVYWNEIETENILIEDVDETINFGE